LAIGSTAQDIRDVLVDGPSGFLAVSPPYDVPRFEASKRRLTWKSGARVTLLSGEEPDRCRGLNVDTLLCDELPHWSRSRETYDLAMLALRAGNDPRCMITTTPKHNDVLIRILSEPTTVRSTETTFANKLHLAPQFVSQIVSLFQNTRFAAQEIEGRLLDSVDGQWFDRYDEAKHVQQIDYLPGHQIYISVDAGTSRVTCAVICQARRVDDCRYEFRILSDYSATDRYSSENAEAIRDQFDRQFPGDVVSKLFIDGASSAKTSIGPASLAEFQRVFSDRTVQPIWDRCVADSLDLMAACLERGDLLIHPRCQHVRDGFKNLARQSIRGQFTDVPDDAHPYRDAIDALKYGILGLMPNRRPVPSFEMVHYTKVL
jgi:hypothetical protein